jgi:integrase
MARYQTGCLRKERRKAGITWVYRYYTTRPEDGKRVEHTLAVGLVSTFPTKDKVWAEVDRLQIKSTINTPQAKIAAHVTFGDLAAHFKQHDMEDDRAYSTVERYKHTLDGCLIPRWGDCPALSIKTLEIEAWLKSLRREGLAWPTLDKIRRIMGVIYKHGQRHELIPKGEENNPVLLVRCKTTSGYEAIPVNEAQAKSILDDLARDPAVYALTLLAAGTGLRISECLGLRWADVNFEKEQIQIRRGWVLRRISELKTETSKGNVPMHPLLAEVMRQWKQATPYPEATDWVFPSYRLNGKKPRDGRMVVANYLRPAALKAGVQIDGQRFGFHNLRHSLASLLVSKNVDPKTVQQLLRRANVATTLGIYAHASTKDRLAAQGLALQSILQPASEAIN